MKFTIRDLMLITALVAVSLGWLVDHWATAARNAAREAKWERVINESLGELSLHTEEQMTFDTPNGPWLVLPVSPPANMTTAR